MAEPRDIEIRFSVTKTLAQRIDALVLAESLQGRAELLTPLIEGLVERKIHEAIVLLRMAGINPSDPEVGCGRGGQS